MFGSESQMGNYWSLKESANLEFKKIYNKKIEKVKSSELKEISPEDIQSILIEALSCQTTGSSQNHHFYSQQRFMYMVSPQTSLDCTPTMQRLKTYLYGRGIAK